MIRRWVTVINDTVSMIMNLTWTSSHGSRLPLWPYYWGSDGVMTRKPGWLIKTLEYPMINSTRMAEPRLPAQARHAGASVSLPESQALTGRRLSWVRGSRDSGPAESGPAFGPAEPAPNHNRGSVQNRSWYRAPVVLRNQSGHWIRNSCFLSSLWSRGIYMSKPRPLGHGPTVAPSQPDGALAWRRARRPASRELPVQGWLLGWYLMGSDSAAESARRPTSRERQSESDLMQYRWIYNILDSYKMLYLKFHYQYYGANNNFIVQTLQAMTSWNIKVAYDEIISAGPRLGLNFQTWKQIAKGSESKSTNVWQATSRLTCNNCIFLPCGQSTVLTAPSQALEPHRATQAIAMAVQPCILRQKCILSKCNACIALCKLLLLSRECGYTANWDIKASHWVDGRCQCVTWISIAIKQNLDYRLLSCLSLLLAQGPG